MESAQKHFQSAARHAVQDESLRDMSLRFGQYDSDKLPTKLFESRTVRWIVVLRTYAAVKHLQNWND